MKKEIRTVVYDELRMEAYRFEGIVQPFPSHFHEHYVIGFVEKGERVLSCRDRKYAIEEGNIVLFNPGDSHACAQSDEGTGEFKKEETLLFLLSYLIQNYGKPFKSCIPECRQEIEKACAYMTEHFTERICLDQICRHAGLSKSTLLRAFTKEKGVTPYRYLETVRINEAKRLLSESVPPMEAAIRTGFSDQSHFTNYFNQFIGLAPGTYREIFSEKEGDGVQHRVFSKLIVK